MERVPTEGVLADAWSLYRDHWQHLASIALIVYVVVGFVGLLLTQLLGGFGALIAGIVSVIGVFWLQGAMVKAIEDIRDGRADLSIADTFRVVRPYLGRIALASLAAFFGVAFGFLFFVIPGLILLTWWVVHIPALVLEDRGAFASLRRSRELVRGWGTSVFGLIVLTILILIVVGLLLGIILSPLPQAVAQFFADLVGGAVTGPFVALTWTLLYYRLREAKETPGPAASPDAPPPADWS